MALTSQTEEIIYRILKSLFGSLVLLLFIMNKSEQIYTLINSSLKIVNFFSGLVTVSEGCKVYLKFIFMSKA